MSSKKRIRNKSAFSRLASLSWTFPIPSPTSTLHHTILIALVTHHTVSKKISLYSSCSTSEKISGKTNEIAGKAKQAVGKAVGSEKTQAKGAVQEAKGKTQVASGKAKDKVKDVVDRI